LKNRRREVSPAHRAKVGRRRTTSRWTVALLVVASAVGGALAGCHPTGTRIVDPLYAAALAALVTYACSRARRWTWLTLSAVAMVLTRDWLVIPAAAALLVAFASVWPSRGRRRVGALIGAVAIQVIMRWPATGFHGLTALIAAVAIFPCLISAYRQSSIARRRHVRWAVAGTGAIALLFAVPFALAALRARSAVTRGVSAAEGALSAVNAGDTASATHQLPVATADFVAARAETASWWSAGAGLIPVASQQHRALNGAMAAGRDLTAVAGAEAAGIDYNTVGYRQGHIDLTSIEAMAGPIQRLDQQLALAERQLAAIRSPWLVAPIQSRLASLGAKLAKTKNSADLAAMAVGVGPGMLGGGGPRHYLIAFMTPSESRGLDGFIGSYGELVADKGSLTLARAGPIGELEQGFKPGTRTLTGPADYLARYGAFHPADFFQDLTYSPDFPTVAGVISQLYPQSGGDHLDGVIALDPEGLASMLAFTGPIDVAGLSQPLTSANAAAFLLKDQYTIFAGATEASDARHDFLQDALQQAFAKLVAGSLPHPQTMAAQLDPAVRQGRILLWSSHPEDTPLLSRLHLDGSFPNPGNGDLLAVTTQNTGNNKIDAYLHRTVDDQVTVDPETGEVSSAVTVTLRNDAPTSGLPPIVLASPAVPGLPPGTNPTWLSVYSPFQLKDATIDGQPLLLSSTKELGVRVFSAYLNVPPGGTMTVKLALAGIVAPGGSYTFSVRRQPMVNAEPMTISLTPAPGWIVGSPTWVPGTDVTQQHQFMLRRS
jgi:hypothetical protein